MPPKISVLITVWGDSPYFPDSLRSVRGQTGDLGDWEIVILTNRPRDLPAGAGGNPNAPEPRVVVHHDPVRGRFFGAGTRACRGDYIAFLNDDDVWRPSKLAAVRQALHRFPEAGYHHHQVEYFGSTGIRAPHLRRLHVVRGGDVTCLKRGPNGWPAGLGAHSLGFNDSAITIRRELLERSYPYMGNMETSEDMFFLFAALATCDTVLSDPRTLSRYRVHGQNYSGSGATTVGRALEHLHWEFDIRAKTYTVIEEMVRGLAPERKDLLKMALRGSNLSSFLLSVTGPSPRRKELAQRDLALLSTWRAYQPKLDLALAGTGALALVSRRMAMELIFRMGIRTASD